MKLQVRILGRGLHPSEQVVEVDSTEGPQRLVIDASQVQDSSIDVGQVLSSRERRYLVELPRETFSGLWRVWVDKDLVRDGIMEGAA